MHLHGIAKHTTCQVFFSDNSGDNVQHVHTDGESMTVRAEIAQRIKARREYLVRNGRSDLTHDYMAKKLSLTRPSYSRKESNATVITAEELAQIAGILRTTVAHLMGEDEGEIDREINIYYNGMPPEMKPAAKAALRAMFEAQDTADNEGTIGKRAA